MKIGDILNSHILNEGKKEDLKAKYSNVPEETFNYFADRDPSGTQKYLEWMPKQYLTLDPNQGPENYIFQNVSLFHQYNPSFKNKDINTYKTIYDLNSAVDEVISKKETKNKEKEVEVLYNSDDFLVVKPLTKEASCKYGANTKWCTTYAEDEKNAFGSKTSGSQKLIYIIDKNRSNSDKYKKVAIHKEGDNKVVFYDVLDKPFSGKFFFNDKRHLIDVIFKTLDLPNEVSKLKYLPDDVNLPNINTENLTPLLKSLIEFTQGKVDYETMIGVVKETHKSPNFNIADDEQKRGYIGDYIVIDHENFEVKFYFESENFLTYFLGDENWTWYSEGLNMELDDTELCYNIPNIDEGNKERLKNYVDLKDDDYDCGFKKLTDSLGYTDQLMSELHEIANSVLYTEIKQTKEKHPMKPESGYYGKMVGTLSLNEFIHYLAESEDPSTIDSILSFYEQNDFHLKLEEIQYNTSTFSDNPDDYSYFNKVVDRMLDSIEENEDVMRLYELNNKIKMFVHDSSVDNVDSEEYLPNIRGYLKINDHHLFITPEDEKNVQVIIKRTGSNQKTLIDKIVPDNRVKPLINRVLQDIEKDLPILGQKEIDF